MFQQRHGVGLAEALAGEGGQRIGVAGVVAAGRAHAADAELLLELREVDPPPRPLLVQLVEYRASDLNTGHSELLNYATSLVFLNWQDSCSLFGKVTAV